jgi:SAM-dependent methyltransferase
LQEKQGFDPRAYWEQRLSESYGLHGVGYASLGLSYNRWLYRIRKRVFRRTVRPFLGDRGAMRVLDVGCGTGFYVDQWRVLGIGQIVGLDLTETAVSHLKAAYPGLEFVAADIGADSVPFDQSSFDVISAFDVLFHIVDDERYGQAMKNVFALLKPGGMFVWSDNFLRHGRRDAAQHQVSRPLEASTELLKDAGFEIVSRRPMFWLMNGPVDSTSRILHGWWKRLTRVVRHSDRVANVVGAMLFPVELTLTRVLRESPTTEIMVCRKPAIGRTVE